MECQVSLVTANTTVGAAVNIRTFHTCEHSFAVSTGMWAGSRPGAYLVVQSVSGHSPPRSCAGPWCGQQPHTIPQHQQHGSRVSNPDGWPGWKLQNQCSDSTTGAQLQAAGRLL